MSETPESPRPPARAAAAAPRLERRELLRLLALAAGGALSPACVSLVAERRSDAPGGAPPALGPDERELLAAACECVLPATDTPGARGAGVPEFIEGLLAGWFEPSEVARFRAGLAGLERRARERAGSSFAAAPEELQSALLSELEQQALAARAGGGPSLLGARIGGSAAPPEDFFSLLKQLVLVGYYTSEIGASRELARFVAGSYEPCIPFAQLGRAWSD